VLFQRYFFSIFQRIFPFGGVHIWGSFLGGGIFCPNHRHNSNNLVEVILDNPYSLVQWQLRRDSTFQSKQIGDGTSSWLLHAVLAKKKTKSRRFKIRSQTVQSTTLTGMVPLSMDDWKNVLTFAAPILLVDEVLKFVGRRLARKRHLSSYDIRQRLLRIVVSTLYNIYLRKVRFILLILIQRTALSIV
jgi:hypothetical protein